MPGRGRVQLGRSYPVAASGASPVILATPPAGPQKRAILHLHTRNWDCGEGACGHGRSEIARAGHKSKTLSP